MEPQGAGALLDRHLRRSSVLSPKILGTGMSPLRYASAFPQSWGAHKKIA